MGARVWRLLPRPLRRAARFVKHLYDAYERDDVPFLAAAIAFYGVLSISPILVFALAVAGVVVSQERAQREVITWVGVHVSPSAADLVRESVRSYRDLGNSPWAVTIAGLVLVVAATRLFMYLRVAIDRIWNVEAPAEETFLDSLQTRLLGFGIVLLLGVVLVVGLLVKLGLAVLATTLGLGEVPTFWLIADGLLYLGMLTWVLYLVYRRLPRAIVPQHHARRGAAATALLLVVGGELIGWYLRSAAATSSFGAAGSAIALVLWIYYAAQVFLVGAEITWLYAEEDAQARTPGGFLRSSQRLLSTGGPLRRKRARTESARTDPRGPASTELGSTQTEPGSTRRHDASGDDASVDDLSVDESRLERARIAGRDLGRFHGPVDPSHGPFDRGPRRH